MVLERAPQAATPASAHPRFGFGRPATPEEIVAWDIDVRPDGTGLPPGRGTVREGAALYASSCVACHGEGGRNGRDDALVKSPFVAGFPFGTHPDLLPERTIGNYWPHATTLYDYIHRAMPQGAPGTLSPDRVYSLTAYLLFLNGIIAEDAVMDAETLPAVVMPSRDRFVPDDRRGGAEIR